MPDIEKLYLVNHKNNNWNYNWDSFFFELKVESGFICSNETDPDPNTDKTRNHLLLKVLYTVAVASRTQRSAVPHFDLYMKKDVSYPDLNRMRSFWHKNLYSLRIITYKQEKVY